MSLQAVRRPKRAAATGIGELERKAAEAAGLLKLLANENRLLILCRLAVAGEMSVGELVEAADLSQSALSQHLAKMREDGLRCHTSRGTNCVLPYRRSKCRAAACAA